MRCIECGAEMAYEIVEVEVVPGGETAAIRQPGWYCWICNTAKHSATDLWVADQAFGSDNPGSRAK